MIAPSIFIHMLTDRRSVYLYFCIFHGLSKRYFKVSAGVVVLYVLKNKQFNSFMICLHFTLANYYIFSKKDHNGNINYNYVSIKKCLLLQNRRNIHKTILYYCIFYYPRKHYDFNLRPYI